MDWRGLVLGGIYKLMFYVYFLKNRYDNIYVGYSADLRERFKAHNYGKVRSTRKGRPWKLIYYEAYLAEKDARTRERTLKRYGSTLGQLKKRLRDSFKQV